MFPYPFHLPKPFTLISLFIFPFIFIYFVSYYSYLLIINFSLSFLFYIFIHNFPSQKRLFLSINFLVDFFILFFLHLCFRLLIFCIFKNSTLSWCNCFKFFFSFCSLWLLNIILLHYKEYNIIILHSMIWIILPYKNFLKFDSF